MPSTGTIRKKTSHTPVFHASKADLFIDDRNLGGLPDWGSIYRMIHDGVTYEELFRETVNRSGRKEGLLGTFEK